eukprot:CAMPEP_0198242882 /NCGR_PEP_ID=MMETSP1446-20131203/22145_1 /TAXON_ID=1461542 ORGANISM="Unidentified sp, Strain CCMP2111" /NCGR_SAMPLE_ID=MMETSP1446 /ASSEMBLY_ACC=CAM_ASM_001112 /LENGTH=662 /DNA_ID=CAMNT_0043926533 /DNA_START=338 /DNA_END=2326 /DNA_ORIENTATION=-
MPSAQSLNGASVADWLSKAGLQHHINSFQGVQPEVFRALLMQDYARYGITKLEDKQKLFRLVKSLQMKKTDFHSSEEANGSSAKAAEEKRSNGELLDLEAEDDLLGGINPGDVQGLCVVSPDLGTKVKVTPRNEQPLPTRGLVKEAATPSGPRPEKIKVCVRKRPLNKREQDRREDDIMEVQLNDRSLIVNEPKQKVDLTKYTERHEFHFDRVFDVDVSNDTIYQTTIMPMLPVVFAGGRASCFAFGQTGSGKTYTMNPLPPRCTSDLFTYVSENSRRELTMSTYEIYGSKVFDLLNARNLLVMREDGRKNVNVVGLQEKKVSTVEEVENLLAHAASVRSTGCTGANSESSRSHCITSFAIREAAPDKVDARGRVTAGQKKLAGKISFIDLAGSERGADTYDNDKQTRMEGAQINKSLLALKECIRALDQEARHIPFRGSKLTEVLRESFVGNSVSVMIANIAPSTSCCENSLNTLRYADRVKEMKRDRSSSVSPQDPRHPSAQQISEAKMAKQVLASYGQPKSNGSAGLTPDGQALPAKSRKSSQPTAAAFARDINNKENCFSDEEETKSFTLAEKAEAEEEIVIASHRQMIEQTMDFVRTEMALLADVDQPGSSVEKYVCDLKQLLTKRATEIATFQKKLSSFEASLKASKSAGKIQDKK